jgi:PHP family Zn ribbon phosphoesterase
MLASFESLSPTGRTIAVLVVFAALYVVSGLLYPNTTCRSCRGRKNFSPTGRNWSECRKCGGSGKKIRPISRLLGRGK